MKNCPYCEAKILNNAKKCKYCWEVVVEEKTVRQCPYCEAEVSETAKKCKHCWEWINEIDENYNNEENNSITKKTTISLGKILKSFLISWIMIESFCFFVYLLCMSWSDYSETMDYLSTFMEMLIFIICFILLIIRTVKTYKILLSSNIKNLHFKSTTTVWWWWFIPIVFLYRPYQAVKDILKNFELKAWINRNYSIVLGRWIMNFVLAFWNRWYLQASTHYNYDRWIVLGIITSFCSIISYFLLIKIIERVNNAQEKIIQKYNETMETNNYLINRIRWAIIVVSFFALVFIFIYGIHSDFM